MKMKMISATAKEAPSLLFSSLPNDIVLNVLARVPRRYHRQLSFVSKKLRSIVRSSEFKRTRSLLGNDRFYVLLKESRYTSSSSSYQWFTFTENRRLVSMAFPPPPDPYTAALTVGPDIYFVGRSKSMWILDSRFGKLRQGPSSLVTSLAAAVGLVNDKIYIFGGSCQKKYYEDIQAQVFDLNTQTWQVAPNPSVELPFVSTSSVSLDRKIYARDAPESIIVYDTRDGKCEKVMVAEEFSSYSMCVVDSVLYMHYHDVGLMWYDSEEKEWRVVHGLINLKRYLCSVQMVEYNGKLAFMWHDTNKGEIWCSMIALYGSSKVAIRGRVEWSDCLLSDVPFDHYIMHFMVCSDY